MSGYRLVAHGHYPPVIVNVDQLGDSEAHSCTLTEVEHIHARCRYSRKHVSELLLHSRGRTNNFASCQLSSPNHYSSINLVSARRHHIEEQRVLSRTYWSLADDHKSAAHHLEVVALALELRPSVQAGRLLTIAPGMHRLTVPVVTERLATDLVGREKSLRNDVIKLA